MAFSRNALIGDGCYYVMLLLMNGKCTECSLHKCGVVAVIIIFKRVQQR